MLTTQMRSTRSHLESFLETTRAFNMIYTKEIHQWTHKMEVPQLHGFGPTANSLLEAYKMLLKTSGESSSVTRIIFECESALSFLNRDLGILSASIAREQGEKLSAR
ncbi:AUGMIN subunit 7 [Quillaja saponaria]|uniref:AUGMIN subunit 7 n=1 Tax=Quillaja saponaria TaxID=32244 RepID=A0AAD7LGT6_QUISA|nr:AUGMIN subunit 7 [Quillaja saponaria]